jgi:hypothetical protein
MGMIIGRVQFDREIVQRVLIIGADFPMRKCQKCGDWIHRETGEHMESISVQEFLDRYREQVPVTPCKAQPAEQDTEEDGR